MGARFVCDNHNRRLLILDAPSGATLNGIDYLEVLDHDAPSGTPRQQTLLVKLFRPVASGLDAENVRIDGGVRDTDVAVTWAQPADAVTVPGEDAPFYAALPSADHILVVRTNKAGDFSEYRLSLVASTTTTSPPPGFDSPLSSIGFSFKVQCPTPFDCREERPCPPAPILEPALDYLAKDAASFRRVLFDRLATIAPWWTDRNPADLAVTVVEALAHEADKLSAFQDAASTDAYLPTAHKRISVRRHARLLDYHMHEGTNARAWVCIEVDDDGVVLRRTIGSTRTRFLTRTDGEPVLTQDEADERIAQRRVLVFEPMHELALLRSHNRIELYTWGDSGCCLPRGAIKATLADDAAARLQLAAGDVLVLEEVIGRDTGVVADADPTRRHAVRLTRVEPSATVASDGTRTAGPLVTDPLTDQAIVEVEWDETDQLPFPLHVSRVIESTPTEGICVARGNVVLADHGVTHPGEALSPAVVPSGAKYRPRLSRAAITHVAPYESRQPPSATETVRSDPRRAVPTVTLLGPSGHRWTARADLLGSDRFARDFVVEVDDVAAAHLRFGDGVMGREPEDGMEAHYRTGVGTVGNVGAEAIAHVVQPGLMVTRIRNPLAATGGLDPETKAAVKRDAPVAFRTQERAVTEADYAAMAMRHPQVHQAVATRRWTGSWHTMFVTVDRRGGGPVDAAFEGDLRSFLERFRLAEHDVEIDPPRLVALDIRLVVCVDRSFLRDAVRKALMGVFTSRVLPDGRRGYFHPDNFTFGQPVHLSAIVAAAMSVPGVASVHLDDPQTRFRRFATPDISGLERGHLEMSRLEIARLDNHASAPEHGRFDLVTKGGR